MRSPSFYFPHRSRRTRPDRKHVSRSPDDTITCGFMLFIFILLAAMAAHGYAYTESVRSMVQLFGSA